MSECDTCKRCYTHGGTCHARKTNCLYYEEDPRGEVKYMDALFDMEFKSSLKTLRVGDTIEIESDIADSAKIRILKIHGIEWNYGKHGISGAEVDMAIEYFSNEYRPKADRRKNFAIIK